ncbi:hypothetical protein CONLIGDRAFT_697879 [Coniochaeta ligniaria NRRL 30616]|uniref:FAM192A/Fyv6 N-terminal domain-containing protein n=1 Tax=Coniochaeta ligniaria NRRL 30616 TaxID=1408157 RepID=A0A1J7JQM6_9PEZI|nr:hypothetical protein CONLIGDRAFT_697879 [Coniochaeta ligniaria NRRL 30616]
MASRFVSAGAIDPTTGEAAAAERTTDDGQQKKPNDEWLAVEKELAAERRRREEQRAAAAGTGERSLFEVLQANKGMFVMSQAKQAAFEEANKIKNQFRALDDDEIDFLDEVKAKQRAEEERLRRETEEGLEAFRAAQRRGGERTGEGDGEDEADETEEWAAPVGGRKRKRAGKSVGIVKRRTTSEGELKSKSAAEKTESKPEPARTEEKKVEGETRVAAETAPVAKPKMGLVSYDSDDDDD